MTVTRRGLFGALLAVPLAPIAAKAEEISLYHGAPQTGTPAPGRAVVCRIFLAVDTPGSYGLTDGAGGALYMGWLDAGGTVFLQLTNTPTPADFSVQGPPGARYTINWTIDGLGNRCDEHGEDSGTIGG